MHHLIPPKIFNDIVKVAARRKAIDNSYDKFVKAINEMHERYSDLMREKRISEEHYQELCMQLVESLSKATIVKIMKTPIKASETTFITEAGISTLII